MVITEAPHDDAPDLGVLPFGRGDLRLGEQGRDAVYAATQQRCGAASQVVLGSWDPQSLAGVAAQDGASPLPHWPTLAVYDGAGQQRYADAQHAAECAAQRAQALAWPQHSLHGRSSVRRLSPGAVFALGQHERLGRRRWRLVRVVHHIADAWLPAQDDAPAPGYHNEFQAIEAEQPWRPPLRPKLRASGVQAAVVTGVDGAALHTERNARVKIQFPWQRGQRPLSGGLPHPSAADPAGAAPGNERASAWVRVAQTAAGPNWGAVLLPRIGSEVLVDFIDGDIDRPLIIGQLYNDLDPPPYAAGQDGGVNHPGTLSGWFSHGLDGGHHNAWVLDDASGQLRMRFMCTQPLSELGLGHLIQQAACGAQRGPARGSGFELASDGWTCVRAAAGLLLSSTARAAQGASVHGAQMDGQASPGAAARRAGPAAAAAAGRRRPAARGAGARGGGLEPRPCKRWRARPEAGGGFTQPLMLWDAAASALYSTEGPLGAYAAQDQHWVAQADMQLSAAQAASIAAGAAR
ncbi:MAG: hypothetical protein KatS3mg122_1902 [Caldimonas sp.]|nr:MAG: hypothetical protein KatS3mg122_1902 [Caldimonas sp.]